MERSLVVSLYLVVCLFQFHPATLQLNLNQRKSIDKYRHIIATFLAAFYGDLVGNLVFILTPLLLVDELNPDAFPIFQLEILEITQFLGFLKTSSAFKVKQNLVKLLVWK